MTAVFWISAALLAYAQAGYALLVAALARLAPRPAAQRVAAPTRAAVWSVQPSQATTISSSSRGQSSSSALATRPAMTPSSSWAAMISAARVGAPTGAGSGRGARRASAATRSA